MIVMFVKMEEILSLFWKAAIAISILLWMISYLLIGFSNPGIVTKKYERDEEMSQHGLIVCLECRSIRERGVRHCNDCGCCVYGHDHHCPWIGKCVGESNKGRFYFFLVMMLGTFILFFLGSIYSQI
jgi:hypothetical protein